MTDYLETHEEFKARMAKLTSAKHRPAGVAMPQRAYASESVAEQTAKRMAVAGYGWEDIRVVCGLSEKRAREIVFWSMKT